jgi:hypothetical protein
MDPAEFPHALYSLAPDSQNACATPRIVYRSVSWKMFAGALRRGLEPSLLKIQRYGSCSAGVAGSHQAFR